MNKAMTDKELNKEIKETFDDIDNGRYEYVSEEEAEKRIKDLIEKSCKEDWFKSLYFSCKNHLKNDMVWKWSKYLLMIY